MTIQKVFVFVKRDASSTQKITQSLPTQEEIQGRQMLRKGNDSANYNGL